MEFFSWNLFGQRQRYRLRHQRQREEACTRWNPIMRMIRNHQQRQEQLREQLRIRQEEESRTVEISHPRTRIRGVLKQSKRIPTLQYVAFLGIPYALPPVGELRFQPPVALPQLPPGQPTPLFLADKASHPCTQKVLNVEMGSEDCLYLNVFTPRKSMYIKKDLPVLVYIHGGGFTMGQNTYTDPENLLMEDLIVVVLNYRLGIFGFLNMHTENCLGNAGLKDQVMALEWVRDNIENFKGDPKNVTICGQSAGASCVNFHMISPLSKSKFHKAIVMAGGVYCPWGFGGHDKHVKQLFKDVTENSKELRSALVDTLKGMRTFELLKFGENIMNTYITRLYPKKMTALFKPSAECVRKGAFLPDPVEKLLEEAQPVPTIAGITEQEGYMYFRSYAPDVINLMMGKFKFVELVKDIIRQNFNWDDPTVVDRHFEFFKTEYFPEDWMLEEEEEDQQEEENKIITEEEKLRRKEEKQWKEEEQKQRLATLVTDILFRRFYDNFQIGNLLSVHDRPPLYVYEFDYFAGEPIVPISTVEDDHHSYGPLIKPKAAQHTDDYFFLFGPSHVDKMLERIENKNRERVRSEIRRVQYNMSSLWSSFCRFGYPTSRVQADTNVKWELHTEQAPRYLQIGKELTLINGRLKKKRWPELNSLCQLVATISSLRATPQTPKPDCEVFQLSQPEPHQSTPLTLTVDEMTNYMNTSFRLSSIE